MWLNLLVDDLQPPFYFTRLRRKTLMMKLDSKEKRKEKE
jgi:hypothetical protein